MTHRIKRKPHKIKTRRSILSTKGFWYAILAVVLLSVVAYFVIFFDKVQIKNISISGNVKAPTNQIESLVLNKVSKKILFLQPKSIFLVDITGVKNEIKENFPIISEVKVTRKFFNGLDIVVKEREPSAIFCLPVQAGQSADKKESCFFIDDTGVASEGISTITEGFVVVRSRLSPEGVVEDSRPEGSEQYENKKVVLGKQVVDEKTLGYILRARKGLGDKYGVIVDSAEIASDIRLNIKTDEGWEVYFNLSDDVDLQIAKLLLLLEKEIPKDSRGALKYIELRFGRAYICDKNSPCSK